LRQYLVVLRSKRDPIRYPVQKITKTAHLMDHTAFQSLEIAPPLRKQPLEFWSVLEKAYKHGGWTVYVDELLYLDRLGLRMHLENLLTQGRSKGISVWMGVQRPAQITRFALSESTHVLSFMLEGRDAKTVGDATSPRMEDAVEQLGRFEFAWYDRISREIWTGKLQDLQVKTDAVAV
jgi:hypothetical protein